MSDIDNDINMALWRAAMCGDSEAVSHALDGKKLLRCVDDRQYKNKMSIGSQIRIAGVDGFQYEVDDLPVTMYGELDYSENYVYPNSNGKTALAIAKNPKVLYILLKHGWDVGVTDFDDLTIVEYDSHIYQEFSRLKISAIDRYFVNNQMLTKKEQEHKLSPFAKEHKKWIKNKSLNPEPQAFPKLRTFNRALREEFEEEAEPIMEGDVVAYINADGFTSIGVIVMDDSLHKSFRVHFNGEEDDVPYDNVEGLAFHLNDLPELILSFEKEIYMYEAILRKIRSNKKSRYRSDMIKEFVGLLSSLRRAKKKSILLLKRNRPEIYQIWYKEKNVNTRERKRNPTLRFNASKIGH